MIDFKTIADNADLIINGYAFTKSGDYIRVLNLNRPNKALVFDYNQVIFFPANLDEQTLLQTSGTDAGRVKVLNH